MALNLSTLTNSATSGDVLAEALTTADFLEPVPVLRNLARGSQKGGDAKQGTALNQPKALPLIDGDGYLYCSGVDGNYAAVDSPVLPETGDFDLRIDFIVKQLPSSFFDLFVQRTPTDSNRFLLRVTDTLALSVFWASGGGSINSNDNAVVLGQRNTARLKRVGTAVTIYVDDAEVGSFTTGASIEQTNSRIGQDPSLTARALTGAVFSVTEGSNTNIDFTATNVRHGDTKFKCATGQVVTINQSGNDPATVIKKPVLRFDGANSSLQGIFSNNINNGYYFAAFSILGNGGDAAARLFSVYKTGEFDYSPTGFIFGGASSSGLQSFNNTQLLNHPNLFDDANGDVLHDVRALGGNLSSRVNNADLKTSSNAISAVDSGNFNIGSQRVPTADNAAIDLEFLALFPASITDAQADSVRSYINNRNNVFDLKDGFGYYFFDPQIFPIAYPAAFVSFWGGNIVGSDLTLNASVSQSVVNHRPTRDGYKVTFNDNGDHLVVASPLSGGQAGWQIVGTSLGTFAYRVNANAVTELNLLGNLGNASYRKTGDLYGIILLPESATGADIEAARKLLIDRGAADGVTGTSLSQYFRERADIVDFHNVDTSNISSLTSSWSNCSSLTFFPLLDFSSGTNFYQTWFNCSSLKSFPLIDASSGTNFYRAWRSCISLNDFAAIDARNGTSFQEAWQNCSSLTSFPAGAKLGTEANNVNFTSAWQQSGLTSFSTPLPTATSVNQAWHQCALLTSFSSDLSAVTTANYAWLSCTSLTSFDTPLPSATQMLLAWYNCSSLTSFSSELPSAVNVNQAWLNCTSLTDFSADVFANWNPSSITTGVFNLAWDGCVNLTAQSVENILTAIDASGKYGTATGAAGGGAIDSGIDIDYNGDTLSAATNTAVTSLKAKGWSIIVNNVTL
jgi:hypothetical protein